MCKCSESGSRGSGGAVPAPAGSMMKPLVPLARLVNVTDESVAGDDPGPAPPGPQPTQNLKPCKLDFREGCYHIVHRPTGSLVTFEGTLRVDRSAPDGGADNLIVSGDLYTRLPVINPPGPVQPPGTDEAAASPGPALSLAAALSAGDDPVAPAAIVKPSIPIFARTRYHSYVKVTSVSAPVVVQPPAKCVLTIVAEQFNYTQPPAGQHKGTFPNAATRTVTLRLSKAPAPFPFSLTGGPFYEGRLFEGAVDKGSVTLAWVSKFFRRATLEIDTLAGAVAPAPVPAPSGGTEFFDTVFADIGWLLKVVKDQVNVPVPAGVVPTNCWSSADLHALMTSVRNPATNLDEEWRVHLMVVPARLGCSRGVMFDQMGVPREGCASFSDDGYPVTDSSNFGTAANQKQRDVPRAFLRSATHEVTHTLNQIHQESETAADNSIMTTTPSVADVLGGPFTGDPGVFPDQIRLAQNTTVRHHLNHMPDPVIRPGGWPFASWFPSGAPQATDRFDFPPTELALAVTCASRAALGQPLDLSWTLTNTGAVALRVPNDVSHEALFTSITVVDGEGRERVVRPFSIVCDSARLSLLDPGKSVSASTKLFWSTAGFAFERPGRYRVNVAVSWSAQGVPVGVQGGADVFVDYPVSDADNQAAGLVMDEEVGKWVALGGGAYHLDEAARRLQSLGQMAPPAGARAAGAGDGGARPRALDGFAGLMPDRRRLARARPDLVSGEGAGSTRATRAPVVRSRARKTSRSRSRR